MTPLVKIENLSYAYPGRTAQDDPVWILDGVDLSIEAGEFVAIMGATGAGKTTLCLALNGAVPQSLGGVIGGQVLLNGINTKEKPVAELSQTVGLVLQNAETQLFNMTVEAEIAFGLESMGVDPTEIELRIDWALELVDLVGFRKRSPFELSGGQKQRVAIAAMLALKPPVLVLDEPTANLDPAGKQELFAAVASLRKLEKMTIAIVSHDAELIAAFADRIVVLQDGKIAMQGAPRELYLPAAQLQALGLHVPGLARLADYLSDRSRQDFAFLGEEEARESLQPLLTGRSPGSQPPINPDPATPIQFALQDVNFHYQDDRPVLQNIDLTIHEGEFIAILGQNGSGKTTLAKQLNGLLRPITGQVRWGEVDVVERSVAQMARTIGYVFQNPDHMIFSATVGEELAAGPRNLGFSEIEITERINLVLQQFSLEEYVNSQPAELSFGLRRKVSVASVVAMDTEVLVLDEPTSGLDQRSVCELMDILTQINEAGRTILLITHDMELVADYVPQALIMQAGRLLAKGSTRQLFCQPALLQAAKLRCPAVARLGHELGWPNELLGPLELGSRLVGYANE